MISDAVERKQTSPKPKSDRRQKVLDIEELLKEPGIDKFSILKYIAINGGEKHSDIAADMLIKRYEAGLWLAETPEAKRKLHLQIVDLASSMITPDKSRRLQLEYLMMFHQMNANPLLVQSFIPLYQPETVRKALQLARRKLKAVNSSEPGAIPIYSALIEKLSDAVEIEHALRKGNYDETVRGFLKSGNESKYAAALDILWSRILYEDSSDDDSSPSPEYLERMRKIRITKETYELAINAALDRGDYKTAKLLLKRVPEAARKRVGQILLRKEDIAGDLEQALELASIIPDANAQSRLATMVLALDDPNPFKKIKVAAKYDSGRLEDCISDCIAIMEKEAERLKGKAALAMSPEEVRKIAEDAAKLGDLYKESVIEYFYFRSGRMREPVIKLYWLAADLYLGIGDFENATKYAIRRDGDKTHPKIEYFNKLGKVVQRSI